MLVEVAERIGPSLEYWLGQPFAFALWTWHQLQELDRQRAWVARMDRINAAVLQSMAFNEPKKLAVERAAAIRDAGPASKLAPAEVLTIGQRILRYIRKGKVLS